MNKDYSKEESLLLSFFKDHRATEIINELEDNGCFAYFVGGCVRDVLLGKEPKDIDIATSATPDEVKELFSHTVDTGIEHGTVTVVTSHGNYEVTTFRKDVETDGRHAKVKFSTSINDDLMRRDFTINAIAYNPNDSDIIFVGDAIQDINDRILKTCGISEERFKEDYLRMLRAVRFTLTHSLVLSNECMKGILKLGDYIRLCSKERIRDEFFKILKSDHPAIGIRLLYNLNLLSIILPEVNRLKWFSQTSKWHKVDVFDHSLQVLENMSEYTGDVILRFSALLHDVGKYFCRIKSDTQKGHFTFHGHAKISGNIVRNEIVNNFRLSVKDGRKLVYLVSNHMQLKNIEDNYTQRSLARYIRKHEKYLDDLIMLNKADRELKFSDRIIEKINELRTGLQKEVKIKPILNGNELMNILDKKQGKWIGELQKELQELQILGKISNKKQAMQFVKNPKGE